MKKQGLSFCVTHAAIRICYVLLTGAAIALPFIMKYGSIHFKVLFELQNFVTIPFYCVLPAGYAALICLDKLMINIKKSVLFDNKNTKLLSIISLACVYAGAVGLISFIVIYVTAFMFETLFILACGEFFMALIVSAVKSIFSEAIKIKDENDLTV